VDHAEAWENLKRAAKGGVALGDLERLVEEWVESLPSEMKRLALGCFLLGVTDVKDLPKRFREDATFRALFIEFLKSLP